MFRNLLCLMWTYFIIIVIIISIIIMYVYKFYSLLL